MYESRDGVASKKSQKLYDTRVNAIVLTTLILSSIGFASAALQGEYTQVSFQWKLSVWGLHLHSSRQSLWPILCFNGLNIVRQSHNANTVYRSGLAGAFLSLLLLHSHFQSLGLSNGNVDYPPSGQRAQIICAVLLLVVQLLIPRRPDVFTPDGHLVDAENSASVLSRWTLSWCLPAFNTATKSDSLAEMPALNFASRASSLSVLTPSSPGPFIWRQLFRQRFGVFVKQLVLVSTSLIFGLLPSFFIMRLLQSLEQVHGPSDEAWLWLFGIGASQVGHALLLAQLNFMQWSEMSVVVNSQVTSSIFHKLLRRKNAKDQHKLSRANVPDATTLVVSDTATLARFSATGQLLVSQVIKAACTAVFMYKIIGWQSTFAAIFVTLASMSVDAFLAGNVSAARKTSRMSRGKTASVLNEALNALREIKYSSLEDQWQAHIDTYRQRELEDLGHSQIADTLRLTWSAASPLITATVAVSTYIFIGGDVTPSVIFPLTSALPMLQSSLSVLPELWLSYDGSRTAAAHIDQYLSAPEQNKSLIASAPGRVSFLDATISWPSEYAYTAKDAQSHSAQDRFSLRDVTLDFPVGELSVISGKTGSGKSLLLAAILGEADLLGGSVEAPSAAASYRPVAYVNQTPWLQNTTIEENILFGSEMDAGRYKKVIAACALGPDLAALPERDQTRIGLRGSKLSGGQRARVAFARALYSSTELIVIDDVFSALDAHVANHILTALTGELGQGRTRILATHHVSLCLPSATYQVHLENNTISYAGNPSLVSPLSQKSETTEKQPKRSQEEESVVDNKSARPTVSGTAKPKRSSSLSIHLYICYFIATGGLCYTGMFVVGLIANEGLEAVTNYYFGRIKSTTRAKDNSDDPQPQFAWLGLEFQSSIIWYLGAAVASIATIALTAVHQNVGSTRASNILFRQMTFKVLRMPVLWLDTTSFGEIIKTFTVETSRVDDRVLDTIARAAGNLVKLTTIMCIGLSTSKYISLVTLVLLAWCIRIGSHYVKARTSLKLGSSAYLGDILEQLSTTSAGLTTIRAFGAERQFINDMHRYLDTKTLSDRLFWVFHDWVKLQLSLVGTAFMMATCGILIYSSSATNLSAIGFSLTFFGQLYRAIFNVINQFGHLDSFMDAVAAVVEFTELETEKLDGDDVPADWPSAGQVEVQKLEASYASHLPPVLKSLTFTAEAGRRIGIVGRTGAGKSSLMLALLRLLEPLSGRVLIDGIDISTVKVKDLRSRVGFIPQDPTLFSGTIRSNLDYFHRFPVDNVETVLQSVGLISNEGNDDAGCFELTVDSPVSAGGANLSQGQRQLLCLARILLCKPKIIVLDEATSAVDSTTDGMIQEVLRTQFVGTLIVVAHRLKTIAAFDQVVVLSDGRIVEQDAPRELLAKKRAFFDLVRNSQDYDELEAMILGK